MHIYENPVYSHPSSINAVTRRLLNAIECTQILFPFANSFVPELNRDALSRKAFISTAVRAWLCNRPPVSDRSTVQLGQQIVGHWHAELGLLSNLGLMECHYAVTVFIISNCEGMLNVHTAGCALHSRTDCSRELHMKTRKHSNKITHSGLEKRRHLTKAHPHDFQKFNANLIIIKR